MMLVWGEDQSSCMHLKVVEGCITQKITSTTTSRTLTHNITSTITSRMMAYNQGQSIQHQTHFIY